jgi:predicted RNA-binding protein associated with RNAse of E/G family
VEIVIHYTRLPDRVTVFRQAFVAREDDCVITLMERTPLRAPVRAGGRIILEPDAPVVWFTFQAAWHDIGRFHTAGGEYTGCYANVLTPVLETTALAWSTTDLCLDVFRHADGAVDVLDEHELQHALDSGWLGVDVAARARQEATDLAQAAQGAEWPPAVVSAWPLERARAAVAAARGTRHGDLV